jgi:2,4-dienoyl-CoA reductase-like NADH-dependent reductase (Old Yellow Enzyme family)/thioredoxin reductase
MFPMGTAYGSAFGEVTQKTVDYYGTRAKGGVGLIIVGNCSPMGRMTLNSLQLDGDWYVAGHNELVEAVHSWGAKIALQLNHSGSRVHLASLEGKQSISSSPVARSWLGEDRYPEPKPLSVGEIYVVIERWAEAAARARQAGYDLVELHGAHGYLISQFLSPYFNRRTDEFGGSLENRMRFLLELFKRVKQTVGGDYPVGVRLSADEFWPGGITLEESTVTARTLEEVGAAYIDIGSGTFESHHRSIDIMRDPEDWKLPMCAAIKKAVINIPTIAGGNFRNPSFCEQVLADDKADFIGLARALFADPEWPNKAREGRVDDIRHCVTCNECLRTSQKGAGRASRRCTVNPAAGREREFNQPIPAGERKKVMIIGGGPGGMEAARVATLRGYDVILFEKGTRLGGGLLVAAAPPKKSKWLWFRDYLETQLEKLGVTVVLNTEVDLNLVREEKADAVIVATGAEPLIPNIPGATSKKVVHAWDVLRGKSVPENKRVLILGGGTVGCETAEFLAERGNEVTIVEMLSRAAIDMERLNRRGLLDRLAELEVKILVGKNVTDISDDGAAVTDVRTGAAERLSAEQVVVALGAKPVSQLAEVLDVEVPELYVIGDCAGPRMVIDAVYEGSLCARRV